MRRTYNHAGVQIYHGDCRELVLTEPADVMITDPDYAAKQERLNRGVHFDREEAQALREFAEYCMRDWVGKHSGTMKMILAKVAK